MKRLTLMVLCLCLAAEAAPSKVKRSPGRAAASSSKAAPRLPAVVPPASPLVVDIHELVPSLRPMPHKEREDQLRDWALYGLLMHLGLDAHALARATHELAPVRLPYLEELFAFEYGRGRRAILSDEQVLLVYEQSDPDPQATLGRLADRVRMEMGTVPQRFELYAFDADVTHGKLRVEFKEALPGQALFSQVYGYQEAVVSDQAGLARWLGSVDDVSFVANGKGGLQLGGRRFAKSRTRGVALEDVAALYQAHSSLAAQRQQQADQYNETLSQGDRELNASIPALSEELARQFPGNRAAQHKELNRRLNDRWREMQLSAREKLRPIPADPAFSLDPRIRAPGLVASLKDLAADPCRALNKLKGQLDADTARLKSTQALPGMAVLVEPLFKSDAADFRARCEALGKAPYRERLQKVATAAQALLEGASEKDALEPLRALRNELKGSTDETQRFLLLALGFAQSANGEQCARYDGPLGGTRVGMNLFYTDLLAKLWTMDVQHSAPGIRVPGFISEARLPPTAYREEALSLSSTRVWFGPRKEAFTRSPDDSELRFQQVATRVFAAGSDPDHPEYLEEAPAENSRRAVGWWERHFADVADYEQEYHLQNQIMKWSAITGFFRAKELAAYLEQVPVGRTAQFGKWYEKTRSELRYPLPLLIGGEVAHECMDLLSTESGISGGVALAGTKLDKIRMVKLTDPPSLRRVLGAPAPAKPVPGELGRAFPYLGRPATIRVEPLRGTRTRMEGVQIELGAIELAHAKATSGDYRMTLRTRHAPVGDFIGTPAPGQIRMSWHPQDIAEAPSLAQRITRNDDAIPVAVTRYPGQTSTNEAFRSWPTPLFVNDSHDVVVPAASGSGYLRVRLSNGASAHAAPTPLSSVMAPYKWQRLSVLDMGASGLDTSQGVVRAATKTGPRPDASLLHLEGVDGFPRGLRFAADNGVLYVASPSEVSARQNWVNLDQTASLTSLDLNKILTAASNGETRLHRSALSNGRAEKMARAIAAEDTVQSQRLLKELSKELGPDQARQQGQRHLVAAGDFQLAQGHSTEASRLYELARDNFGDVPPDALIRESLAKLHKGSEGPASLQAVLDRHASKLTPEEGVQVLKTTAGLADMRDVQDVLLHRLGFQGPIPEKVASQIHLERDGPDLVSIFRSEKPLRGKPVPPGELRQGLPQDATIYVEDRISANKNDFQASPAEHVAELGSNPQVEVLRLQEMPSGTYRPGKVYAKEEAGQAPGAERIYRRIAGPNSGDASRQRIFLIHQKPQPDRCDTNKDGTVSEQELRLCKAA